MVHAAAFHFISIIKFIALFFMRFWRGLVTVQASALDLGERGILRVADLGCGLLPLLEDFRFLAKACGARKLEYCGLEKEIGVAMEACQVGGVEWGECFSR